PRSTLFPYTTLFRSWADLIVEWPHFCGIFDCSSLARFGTVTFSNAQYYCASGSHCSPQGQSGEVGLHGDIDTNFKVTINECGCQDRKSTRLNSSHEW